MNEIKNVINKILKATSKINQEIEIALISNSRSKTKIIENMKIQYSDENEFFTDKEYSEILDGIQTSEFYVHAFFNELNFMSDILNKKFSLENKIVYNLARNGKKPGKKSLIPSFCDLITLPYTGSNAFVISLCRAKYTYSKYLEAHGISIPKSWIYIGQNKWLNDSKPDIGTQIIVKSMSESASIDIDNNSINTFNKNSLDFLENIFVNRKQPLFIQEFISGFECEVPLIISNEVHTMPPVGISINNNLNLNKEILTYERSFEDDYNFYNLSEVINKQQCLFIQELSAKIAKIIGLQNYGRIDFRIDNLGNPYLIDIASTPYTTKHSSFAFAFDNLCIPYSEIYSTIIGITYLRYKNQFTSL
ncbi:MAG: hypothetical protein LKH93_15880 [Clostridium beijerinckii]|jgi:D-alanine-D-alanine ligase|uniref:hypothetical protein n=1 Tax=Clostridium TaxID=1485 RepID=UPI000CFA6314|nr:MULTISPECIES: hypothetical protein [Clostridium]AVK46889.1 hypothetical protein AXY43_01975 [Clostridium sp. MF28]MCI1583474.1 hypothetical protein [Clostridium beijerinckii]MCI1623680.1 hypothetical protein [Clostridium beijerinckii]PSM59430.1 hypothetical protein C4L39_01435 [Clostridium diolis]